MSIPARPKVAVVGGGITGLAAAHTLRVEAPGIEVVVLEAEPELGGKLRSVDLGEVRLEAGADSFLIREPFALALCEDLGLRDELVEPAVFGGLVWDQKGARPLATGAVMGVPTSPMNLMRSSSVPLLGRIRALADLVLPGPLVEEDIAVGPFLRRRFGRALVDRMVDPILAGTRAGDLDELSLRSAMPQVDAAARAHRSVMKGLGSVAGSADLRPRFKAPRTGMQQLISALAANLGGAEIKTSTSVTSVTRVSDKWQLRSASLQLYADAVLVAAPASAASRMLSSLAPDAAARLGDFASASVASIGLAYAPGSLRFPSASSGFLVPSTAGRLLNAGTWWSLKWPHAANGVDVVRCFIGRAGRHPALDLDDDELARRAAGEIGQLLRTSARPAQARVDRWEEGLPQYRVGHAEDVERIEKALRVNPGLEVAGAHLRGSGIPDCVRQGTEAARRLIRHLSEKARLESPGGTPSERKEKP